MKTVKLGEMVKFVDSVGREHDALVTAIWGDPNSPTAKKDGNNCTVEFGYDESGKGDWLIPAINVVIVSSDEARGDQYGRQLERSTSVCNKAYQAAHGMFWYQV